MGFTPVSSVESFFQGDETPPNMAKPGVVNYYRANYRADIHPRHTSTWTHTHVPGIWMSRGHRWKNARCTGTEHSCPCQQLWVPWMLEQTPANRPGGGRILQHIPAPAQRHRTGKTMMARIQHQTADIINIQSTSKASFMPCWKWLKYKHTLITKCYLPGKLGTTSLTCTLS